MAAFAGIFVQPLYMLAEALAASQKNGWRLWEPELYRVKGELLLRQTVPDAHEAETCFRQALEITRWKRNKKVAVHRCPEHL